MVCLLPTGVCRLQMEYLNPFQWYLFYSMQIFLILNFLKLNLWEFMKYNQANQAWCQDTSKFVLIGCCSCNLLYKWHHNREFPKRCMCPYYTHGLYSSHLNSLSLRAFKMIRSVINVMSHMNSLNTILTYTGM